MLTPFVLRSVIDQIIPKHQSTLLLGAIGLIFFGYEGRVALTSLGNYLTVTAAQRMGLSLRMSLLRHLDTLPAEYYEETPLGTVMYPLKEPIEEICYFGSDLLPAILRMVLTMGVTFGTMVVLSPQLTLAVFPLAPVFLATKLRFRRRLANESENVQDNRIAWSNFLEEHLSAVIPIQLLVQQRRQERKAFRLLARSVRSNQKLFTSGVWFSVWTSLWVVLSISVVIGYGGMGVIRGALSLGSLVAFYSFVTQLFEPLAGTAELYARAQKTFASIRKVQFALALKPYALPAVPGMSLSLEYSAQIDFVDAEFGYQRQKKMLCIPSLRILPGERVAIVGENGAGKSTIAKLIARLYDVDFGAVLIGGHDVRSISLESIRHCVCYLPRDPVLFDGTLASNLRFAQPSASEHEMRRVIECVDLSEFVASLPLGLRQRIGPGACQLSGGQRQRLAIARSLLQQPRILILDEATSCLDFPSQGQVLANVQDFLPSSTLIVISHHLSSMATFERVLGVANGRVAEIENPICNSPHYL